jgi:U3 small nucleolar RNA-associated protein 10
VSVFVVADLVRLSRTIFSRHRRRVTEYLLSHIVSCGLPAVKLSLGALLEGVSDRAKAEALSPTIQALVEKEQASEWEKLFGLQFEEFVTITISALDSSVSGHLNDTSGTLWPIFLDAIKCYFQPGKCHTPDQMKPLVLLILGSLTLPREVLSKNLQSGLFSRLSLDRQTELCGSIITIGAGSSDAVRPNFRSSTIIMLTHSPRNHTVSHFLQNSWARRNYSSSW